MRTRYMVVMMGFLACSKPSGTLDNPLDHPKGTRVLKAGCTECGGSGYPGLPPCMNWDNYIKSPPPDVNPNDPPKPGENCIDTSIPARLMGWMQSYPYIVLADIDLDYGTENVQTFECASGEVTWETTTPLKIHKLLYFKPVTWFKGDGSEVTDVSTGRCWIRQEDGLGVCDGDAYPDMAGAEGLGAWQYLSYGRNLLFLGETCCLEKMQHGLKKLFRAFPVEGDYIFDKDGTALLFNEIQKMLNSPIEPCPPGSECPRRIIMDCPGPATSSPMSDT